MGKDSMISKFKNLKKAGSSGEWVLENIRDGFAYFNEIYGKYPSSTDLNTFEYLPNRRTIERSFGGIVHLRKKLEIESPDDLRKGKTRSDIASETFKRSQDYEHIFFNKIIKTIPEIRVHEHKIIRPGNTASDFFIYTTKDSGIFLDLFYAKDLYSLSGIVNIKCSKLKSVDIPVYLILSNNDSINQEDIEKIICNKKIKLKENIKVVKDSYFMEKILPNIKLEPIFC